MGHIDNLCEAFSNGKLVVMLTQLIFGEKIQVSKNDPALKHKLINTQKCLELIARRGVAMEAVSAEEIVNGQKISIKILCQALEREHNKLSASTKQRGATGIKSNATASNPITSPSGKGADSKNAAKSELVEQTITLDVSEKLSLEDIRIETAAQSADETIPSLDAHQLNHPTSLFTARGIQTDKKAEVELDIKSNSRDLQMSTSLADSHKQQTSLDSDKVKPAKNLTIEIPSLRVSNKFLPSPPRAPDETPEETQTKSEFSDFKKMDSDAKILRAKSKQSREDSGQVPKQMRQRRYSPLNLQSLAGKLFDAFNAFSSNDLPDLIEETTEESLLNSDTMDSELTLSPAQPTDTRDMQEASTSVAIATDATVSLKADSPVSEDLSAVRDSLTVLPPLALGDLTPEVGDAAMKKDAKRILRKTKRQATSIELQDVESARQQESLGQELGYSFAPLPADQLVKQDSINSDRESTETIDRTDTTREPSKQRKREKSSSKDNHRLKSVSRNESALTETHSLEDIWQEIQRMKTTVRTHHAIASRFAQDYPVMRRCFETQNQSVRRLERSQHARSRNMEKELQDKLALMEGYLVQTMRENADLRSKVWGLTTRLTQLEKSGVSSRPSSLFSEAQKRNHSGILDMAKFNRFMKLKKFFGEEPPPLLEEIPTSFTHDTSKEDDEIV